MMNYFFASNREMAQKNGSIRNGDCYNQMLNSYQSLGSHSRTSQSLQQRPQNYTRPINFIQEKYHENNMVDARTHSMVPYASSSNNNASLTTAAAAARYGGMFLPLSLPNGPPEQKGSSNFVPLNLPSQIDSVKKFSFNGGVGVGVQSHHNHYANSFSNPSTSYPLRGRLTSMNDIYGLTQPKTTFNNQKNFPSLSHGANSLGPNHQIRNKSSVFNDLNFRPKVDMNDFHSVKDISKAGLLPPVQIQNLDMLSYKDLTRERAMKRPLCEFLETDVRSSAASKRPRMSLPPPSYLEGMQCKMKELPLLKDGKKHPFSSTLNIKKLMHKRMLIRRV